MADIETVLCVKNEVFVYRIPARTSNRGYRAAEWKLDQPDWTGRLRVCSLGTTLSVKLEDKSSGELFAKCPVDMYPGPAVEQVLDSSRYFVLRLQNDSGRSASIGIGFADRGDSFDLLVAIQDHFKWVKRESTREEDESKAKLDSTPKLDLGFKEGQTIKLNIASKKPDGSAKSKPKTSGTGFLPPPPSASKQASQSESFAPQPLAPTAQPLAPTAQPLAPTAQPLATTAQPGVPPTQAGFRTGPSQPASNVDLLLDLGTPATTATTTATTGENWGDFTSAFPGNSQQQQPPAGNWVNFE